MTDYGILAPAWAATGAADLVDDDALLTAMLATEVALAEAQAELVLGHWWQLVATTISMALFVTAFSLLTDALRDALDPKLR